MNSSFPVSHLETYGNAHATIPADQVVSAMAPQQAYLRIVSTTARNYQLEATLDKLAAEFNSRFGSRFPNPSN